MRVGHFDSGEDVDDSVGIFDAVWFAPRYRAGTFARGGHGAARQQA